MNFLAVFCYITMACDPSKPAAKQPVLAALLKIVAPASTNRSSMATNQSSAIATLWPASPTTVRSAAAAVALAPTPSTTVRSMAAAVALAPSTTARSGPAVALAVDGGSGRVAQQLQLQNGKTVRQTESSTYSTRYDYIDVEAVMNNERIIKILFNCVLNRGPCTREGLELKRVIPDAIQTECAKCTERQKKQAGKALAYLLTYRPEYWKTLVQKFDPNNVYLRKFMADDDDKEKNATSKAN